MKSKTIKDYKPKKRTNTPIAFFHYWEDGNIKYQGYIVQLEKDRSAICQLFEWFFGSQSDEITVTSDFFDKCTFYDSDTQMNSAYYKHKRMYQ